MNFNKRTIGVLIVIFFWSIFMGVTAISIGVGALYPPLNNIAKPFVCPNGKLSFEQNVNNPRPGTTVTTAVWICTDSRSGSQTVIDAFKMGLYAGPFYGLLLFLVVWLVWYMNATWGSESLIGKIVRRVEAGVGILLLGLLILFPALPLLREFLPGAAPTSSPTVIPTVPPAALALPPAAGAPTIDSLELAKAVRSADGLNLHAMTQATYHPLAHPGTETYAVLLPVTTTVQWEYGWCATTSTILAANVKNIQMAFVLDGQSVPLGDVAVDDHPGNGGEECHTWYLVLSDWPAGVHHLTTITSFTSQINDGNSDYAAGEYVEKYTVYAQP
jgi:hypothetical protein